MSDERSGGAPRLPRAVWVLGLVSLLTDVGSELVHSLLPVFLVSSLGAGAAALGLIEGVAESTAMIVKVFSGALSDYLGERKRLAVFGYGVSALSKPLFALARAADSVLLARVLDRIGKGVRGAPRDALIADIVPASRRGAAYGLRQALDTVGAFIGPILAVALMLALKGRIRAVFWFASIPGLLSVTLLATGVREPQGPPRIARLPVSRAALEALPRAYWRVVAVGAVFSLARFSEAFLVLRARQRGVPDAWAPAVFILMNVVYALAAYPVGRWADRADRRGLLAAGLTALALSNGLLAREGGLLLLAAGVALWGLHLALTQGVLAAMVADAAPVELRGSAFGFFNLAGGAALLAASVSAGVLWDAFGAGATFAAGAALSAAALAGAGILL